MYVSMYICMYVCICVCVYVCVFVCVCIYIYIYTVPYTELRKKAVTMQKGEQRPLGTQRESYNPRQLKRSLSNLLWPRK